MSQPLELAPMLSRCKGAAAAAAGEPSGPYPDRGGMELLRAGSGCCRGASVGMCSRATRELLTQ